MTGERRAQKALITGGAAGLGAAMVAQLLEQGCDVWVIDRDCSDAIPPDRMLQCDLLDLDAVRDLAARMQAAGPFDLVVMSAGISAVGPFETLPPEAVQNVMTVNCIAPVMLTRDLIARDLIARAGRLVFVSSLSHFTGYPGASAYAASKDALVAFAQSLRRPLRTKLSIMVQVAAPGPMRTAHADRYAPAGSSGKGRAAPADVARMILRRKRRFMILPGLPAQSMAQFGRFFPQLATRAMRKIIFERLS